MSGGNNKSYLLNHTSKGTTNDLGFGSHGRLSIGKGVVVRNIDTAYSQHSATSSIEANANENVLIRDKVALKLPHNPNVPL